MPHEPMPHELPTRKPNLAPFRGVFFHTPDESVTLTGNTLYRSSTTRSEIIAGKRFWWTPAGPKTDDPTTQRVFHVTKAGFSSLPKKELEERFESGKKIPLEFPEKAEFQMEAAEVRFKRGDIVPLDEFYPKGKSRLVFMGKEPLTNKPAIYVTDQHVTGFSLPQRSSELPSSGTPPGLLRRLISK